MPVAPTGEYCISEGCVFPGSYCKRMCRVHYTAWRRARMPECKVEGCTRKSLTRGMCNQCYQVWYREHQKSLKISRKAETAVLRYYTVLEKLDKRGAFFLGALVGLFCGVLI